jgi:hypothetical protein
MTTPRFYIGIDPGPLTSGVVVLDRDGRVVLSEHAADVDRVLAILSPGWPDRSSAAGIERIQSRGIAGASLFQTAEMGGRFFQAALYYGHTARWIYRREVLAALDVTGKGSRDAMVRQALIEVYDGSTSIGTKRNPGPLYGVKSHAWQALAVAWVVREMEVPRG